MSGEQQQYLAGEVALWLQYECGDSWIFLGCHNVTGVSAPRGDTNPVYCRVGKNKFAIQRTWRGTPGLGSMTLVAYDTVLNYLQELPCAFNLAVLHSAEDADDDPTNFDYLYYYNGVELTSEETDTHVVGINPDEQTPIMLSMPASFRQRLKVKAVTAQERDVSALTTNDLNAVTFCDDPSCDSFGNLDTIGCQVGYAASDGTTAKILKTTDGGGSWTGLSSPFTDADHNIIDIACDGDVVIAVNGEDTAYAYSWDAGASWSEVTTPTQLINRAYMLGGTKIWFVAQNGYIYYSSNRGASIVTQDAGVATSQSLNDISAADSLTLYAVGDNNAFVRTTDGGEIWSAVTGPAAAIFPNDLYRVLAIPGTDIVFVGDEQGNVYRSEDNGDTWTTVLSNTNLAGGIRGLVACDCNVIMVAGNSTDPYFYAGATGYVYQSVDGGNSWFGVEIPTNTGVLDLICCDVNRYWIVGVDGFMSIISGPHI
jgi:photosystem II stability/assembly factor-like uncharacterized protein